MLHSLLLAIPLCSRRFTFFAPPCQAVFAGFILMEIIPGLLFLALKAKLLSNFPLNLKTVVLLGILLRSSSFGNRSTRLLINPRFAGFFDSFPLSFWVGRLFVGRHQIDDLLLEVYLGLEFVVNLILEPTDLLD